MENATMDLSLKSIEDMLSALQAGRLREYLHANLELKRDWSGKNGAKISALSNKLDQIVSFLVVGVSDNGKCVGYDERWAKQLEEIISQQVNQSLDPVQACKAITACEQDGSWMIVITIQNPGEVTYWGNHAYQAVGSTLLEMEPHEILQLRMKLPGLIDYSRQTYRAPYDAVLTTRFAAEVDAKAHPLEARGDEPSPRSTLKFLGLHERQAARILFGKTPYRVVEYSEGGEPVRNQQLHGLFGLLLPEFIDRISGFEDTGFPKRALKEGLANAVAHAAYFENEGDIIVEVYHNRVVISNLCLREASYFANRWFSRSHKTVNGLLMESLRVAGFVDELGRGKNLIFSDSIKLGKLPPEVQIEMAGKYHRWKLTIYGGVEDFNRLRVLERCREIYRDERKALIALALSLWKDLPVSEIRKYVDSEFARHFAEVLAGEKGPILYSKTEDRVVLRRWAEVLLGEGKDSKMLSPEEEEQLLAAAHERQKKNRGAISPSDIRMLAAMGNTPSEKVLSSTIIRKWVKEGKMEKTSHGRYRMTVRQKPAQLTLSYDDVLELFFRDMNSTGRARTQG